MEDIEAAERREAVLLEEPTKQDIPDPSLGGEDPPGRQGPAPKKKSKAEVIAELSKSAMAYLDSGDPVHYLSVCRKSMRALIEAAVNNDDTKALAQLPTTLGNTEIACALVFKPFTNTGFMERRQFVKGKYSQTREEQQAARGLRIAQNKRKKQAYLEARDSVLK